MSDNLDTFWDNKTEQEKDQIWNELDNLCRKKKQEIQSKEVSTRKRIEDIRKKWPLGGYISE